MITVETAILDLFNALYDQGITLEHIKIDKPLQAQGGEIKTLHGIEIKTTIYEEDATHWKRGAK